MEGNDREATDWPGHPLASEISERIREVIGAAEAAAGAIRHEAEQEAQTRRRAAEDEARRVVADARNDAEALITERVRRISELSDSILARGEAVVARVSRAEEVKRELEQLVDALGESAAELARQARVELGAHPVREPPPEPVASSKPDPAVSAVDGSDASAPAETDEVEPAQEPAPPDLVDVVEATATEEPGQREQPPPEAADSDDELLGARLVALQMAVAGGNRGEVEAHLRRAFHVSDPQPILDDVFGPGTDASKRVVWPSAAEG